jgi:SAM-dependent methyltransferase
MNYKNYHRDKDYLANESLFRNIFLNRVNLISKFINKGKVLELGCSTGVMLKLFKERGWHVLGVEPSASSDEAEKKGLRVLKVKFEEVKLPKNHFDLIILNHVLEHLTDPENVLRKIYTLLKDNGFIFIDVPNFRSLSSIMLGKRWPFLLPDEHKSQFTKKSLTVLLEQTRFEVIHWESRSGIFEYANPFLEFRQSLIGLKKRFIFDLCTMPYALCATLLNMGDSMSFIVQKK